jgi:rSAM/selenodomain-associated transferase 1
MESNNQKLGHSANDTRTLVIMAKAPRPGQVKTRLAQSLPALAVTALYRCLLADTVSLAKSLTGVEVAVICPESDTGELALLLGDSVHVVAQKGQGLGAGLTSVFAHFTAPRLPEDAAAAHPGTKAGSHRIIAFNSDSPHLSPAVLESAFQALATNDLVVGPTDDGGYYLVGAKVAHPTLFENDGLGTSSALDRLLARAHALRLSSSLTEPFYDIDVVEDLIRLAPELALAPARAPRTAAWLAEWAQAITQLSGTGKQ